MTFLSRCISDCFYGNSLNDMNVGIGSSGGGGGGGMIPASRRIPDVILDTSSMGQEAVVVKNGSRLCGTGAVKASTPILQNKAYWEIKIQQSGIWSAGLVTPAANLNSDLGQDRTSWSIKNNGNVMTNNQIEYSIPNQISEGDVLGFTYDHVELNFYLNGINLNCPLLGIKGTVFSAIYVDEGAILDAVFENFRYPPPPGFDRIMVEKALL